MLETSARRYRLRHPRGLLGRGDPIVRSADHDGRNLKGRDVVEDPGAGQHARSLGITRKPNRGHSGFDPPGHLGLALGLVHKPARTRGRKRLRSQTFQIIDAGANAVRHRGAGGDPIADRRRNESEAGPAAGGRKARRDDGPSDTDHDSTLNVQPIKPRKSVRIVLRAGHSTGNGTDAPQRAVPRDHSAPLVRQAATARSCRRRADAVQKHDGRSSVALPRRMISMPSTVRRSALTSCFASPWTG